MRPVVQPGVYFQLRYVTMVMAEGIPRPPLPMELATAPLVRHPRPKYQPQMKGSSCKPLTFARLWVW
jgi:hypothetical protein